MVSWPGRGSSSDSPPAVGRSKLFTAAVAVAIVTATITMVNAAERPIVEEYAIVVSPDVTVTSMDLERVRQLFFFRERFWKPELPVRLLYSESGIAPRSFLLERVYRMDYASLRRLIIEKLYQEEIDLAPKVVASDDVAVAFVAAGSGLIALVHATAARRPDATVIAIDGVLPGAPGYALRR